MTDLINENIKYKDILVELMSDNNTFGDFCDTVDKVFEEQIDFPLGQLNKVRCIRQIEKTEPVVGTTGIITLGDIDLSDSELRRETLRMLGFDVTRDFVTLNANIARIPYMFSHYYENSHSNDFWRFISFVLGRDIIVTSLFTSDYKSFYDTPYGTENINGGDWYKTTHVDVTVDINNLSGKLVATPGKTFQDRILDLFYEFSPAHLVIHNFLFSLTAKAQFSLIGTLNSGYKQIYYGGTGLFGGSSLDLLQGIEIDGDATIIEGSKKQYRLRLVWSSIYSEIINFDSFQTSDFRLLSIDQFGEATAYPTTVNELVTLSAQYGSFTVHKTVTIVAVESLNIEQSITIIGQNTVSENTTQRYMIRIAWSNGTETNVSDSLNLEWTSTSPLLSFYDTNKGMCTINSTTADAYATMYLQYTTSLGIVFNTSKRIQILNVDSSIFLSYILINGPLMVNEDQTYSYTCTAYFSDGNELIITPIWYLKSTAGKVATDGTLTTFKNDKTLDITLNAEYEYRGIVQKSKAVLHVMHLDEYLVDAQIIGLDTIVHRKASQFRLSAVWSDGTQTYVKADSWSTSNFYIDETGLLNVGVVDISLWMEVHAIFTYKGAEHTYTKYVRVITSEMTFDFITIKGPNIIQDAEQRQLYAFAHYSDGSRNLLPASSHLLWSVDEAYADITVDGVLSLISQPTATVVTVNVRYRYLTTDGNTIEYISTHYVTVIVPLITVDRIEILGPSSLYELSKEQYTINATNSDGSFGTISPDWSIITTETRYESKDLGRIDRNGFFAVRSLIQPTIVIIKAEFFGLMAYKLVTLNKFEFSKKLPPYGAYIDGPNLIDSKLGYGQYTLYIKDTIDSQAYAVSASWSLTANPIYAIVDDYGVVRIVKYLNINTQLTATYGCGYADPIVVHKNIVLPGPLPTYLVNIVGPRVIFDQSIVPYTAFITRKDHTIVDITKSPDAIWSMVNQDPNTPATSVTLSSVGELTAIALDHNDLVTLRVDYVENTFDTYSGTLDVSILIESPTFGVGPFGILTQAMTDIWVMQALSTSQSGALFTMNIPPNMYGYFMHPVEYGEARFINTLSELEGGWDAVLWPNGEIGTTLGPTTIDIVKSGVTRQYSLYRTDFGGYGVIQFQVFYANR